MIDLDKLSYTAYGNLVIIVLTVIAILFNIIPFSILGLVICLLQIPIYLVVRGHLEEPIHAEGLNICFVLTILFYILLFLVYKISLILIGTEFSFIIATLANVLSCYFTSTKCNEKKFFGYKKHSESKYDKLLEYIKYNGLDTNLIEAERRLKDINTQVYLVYLRKFREDKTFKDISDEFDLDNGRIVEILDKAYFYMIGALKI